MLVVETQLDNKNVDAFIIMYGPTKEEGKDNFFETLQLKLDKAIGNKMLMGDINSRVGRDNLAIEKYLGQYEYETKIDNWETLIGLCIVNVLAIMNSKFKYKDMYNLTREVPLRREEIILRQ